MKFPHLLVIITFYFLVAIIFTHPLILHLNEALPGKPMDGFLYVWNIDTFWREISDFKNPLLAKRIFYPIGTNLIFHTYAPLISLPGIFFIDNLVLYLNLLIIASLAFSAFATFLLAYKLIKNRLIALVSGLLYGFSPIMMSFIWSQHYYFVYAAPCIPLGVLMLLKFLETFKMRYIIGAFAVWWACFFIDYYTTILLIITIACFLLVIASKDRETLKRLFNQKQVLTFLKTSFLVFVIPLVLLFIAYRSVGIENFSTNRNEFFYSYCNANLAGFLTPSELNPFLNNISLLIQKRVGLERNYDTPSYFLGWTLLSLAIVSALNFRKNIHILAISVSGLVIFLLSLGTIIRFGETEILKGSVTPFHWFSQLPLLGLVDCPLRFPVAVQLSVALLVGYIFVQKIKVKRLQIILTASLIILFIFEYGSWPMEISPVSTPAIYKKLALYPDRRTVLELPSGIAESKGAFGYDWSITALHSKQLYWQTLHKKPRVGGYISRLDHGIYEFYRTEHVISDIFTMTGLNGEWAGNNYSQEEITNFVEKFNLGYIILSPNPRQAQFKDVVEDLFSKHISSNYDSEGFILYTLK